MNSLSKNKIVLGLSGGVDSTTAALLLKERGFQVVGYYFDVLGNNVKGREQAETVAEELGIELICKDLSDEFSRVVVADFCSQYSNGRTPNPCVICNPNIKFKYLIQTADEIGAYYIATGHYAKIHRQTEENLFYIAKGDNQKKDQSYMLYRLGQDVLSRLIFPLGELSDKEETRQIAKKHKISNWQAADSMEICFIDEKKENYIDFLTDRGFGGTEGNFVDSGGRVLGKHTGLCHYTVGQRKGLGIALGKPAFVTKIDGEKNTVTLGDNEDLFSKTVYSSKNFFTETGGDRIPDRLRNKGFRVHAKIRYAAKPASAILSESNGRIEAVFDQPQRAATPGQSIVFYVDDFLIGGGIIE